MQKHKLKTQLGVLNFELVDQNDQPLSEAHTLTTGTIQPELPEHMSVEKITAVLLSLTPNQDLKNIRWICRWEQPLPVEGSPSAGEDLETFSWEFQNRIVTVGTEDFEALEYHLPCCGLSEEENPVRENARGVEIHIPFVKKGTPFSLHYLVAENPFPEPAESSTWFAVDLFHHKVKKQLLNTFVPAPSRKLLYQNYTQNDFSEFDALMKDPVIRKYTTGVLTSEQSRQRFEDTLSGKEKRWALFSKKDLSFVGDLGLLFHEGPNKPFVAYTIKKEYQRQGLATEAVQSLIRLVKQDLGMKEIFAEAYVENLASHRVLDKIGFDKIGQSKDNKGVFFIFQKFI